jgi:hypothetical protein
MFGGGVLSDISNDLKEAYEAKQKAVTDKEKIAADERISILEARRSIVLASTTDPVGKWVRAMFALPFIIYLDKLLIWDKVLGFGRTDNITPDLWNIFAIILGGFFLDSAGKTLKGR